MKRKKSSHQRTLRRKTHNSHQLRPLSIDCSSSLLFLRSLSLSRFILRFSCFLPLALSCLLLFVPACWSNPLAWPTLAAAKMGSNQEEEEEEEEEEGDDEDEEEEDESE